MPKIVHSKIGQALVEFALAATLIFFLLAAAVDLGLIFFAIQGLHNAAQEGASYGSRWMVGTGSARKLDINGISERVRKESGIRGGIGFVNLLDLNNDGIRDVGPTDSAIVGVAGTTYQKMPDNTNVISNFIQIQLLADGDTNGDPMNDLVAGQPTVCTNPASPEVPCYIRVTVQLNYKTVFPLTPGFARTTLLHSSYIVRLRDPYSAGGVASTPALIQTNTPLPTATPTPTPIPLLVDIQKYYRTSGSGSRAINITVKVTQGGVNITGATVTAKFGSTTYTLTSNGSGIYKGCGLFTATSLPTSVIVNGSYNSLTGTDSASGTVGSSTTCP